MNRSIILFGVLSLAPALVFATPSTTYWAPSTATCQAWKVPHITYDTYFGKGASAGTQGAPNYPIDTGLTMGVLPLDKLQGEIGFDFLLPTPDPFYLNAKLCTPESSFFGGSPGIAVGIYNMGFKKDVTDYNVLYAAIQKTIPGIGGYLSLGVYHGLSRTLMANSDGNSVQTGLIAGFFSPDIEIGLKSLKKMNFTADIQTGKNILGAWGLGSYIYFTDSISLLTGPVFFLDKALQPGGKEMLWTLQLDIDLILNHDKP